MPDTQIWKLVTDYGIAIVGLIFLTRFLMWLIKYILERNKQREDVIMAMMTNDLKHLTESMNTLTLNMTNFTNSVSEAHKFQREEHKDQSAQHVEMIPILKEITVTLGRINGFREEGK
jgi:hypothetical protein